jgi:hypothetical protein
MLFAAAGMSEQSMQSWERSTGEGIGRIDARSQVQERSS